jgi:predicted nucleic acid-binding protein
MLVVADTSPINYLVLLAHTALLPTLYTRVFLPPAVVTELQDPEAPEAVRTWYLLNNLGMTACAQASCHGRGKRA